MLSFIKLLEKDLWRLTLGGCRSIPTLFLAPSPLTHHVPQIWRKCHQTLSLGLGFLAAVDPRLKYKLSGEPGVGKFGSLPKGPFFCVADIIASVVVISVRPKPF